MKLILYNNFSETNKLNKKIVKIIELNGYLREASSLINPSIMIELEPNNLDNTIVDDNKLYVIYNGMKITWDNFIYNYVLSANYVKIEEFNRFYFITDIISVRNNLWRLEMHFDALMSYKMQILNLNAFVTRNEFRFNNLLDDKLVNFKYDKEVIEEEITNDSTLLYKNTDFTTEASITDSNTIVNVITEENIYSGYTVVKKTNPPLTQIPSQSSSDITVFTSPVVMSHGNLIYLSDWLLNDDTLVTYINSIVIYPFNLDYYGALDNPSGVWAMKLGKTQTDVNSTRLKNPYGDTYTIAEFTLKRDNLKFYDFEPYTEIDLFIPYLGWRTFNTKDLYNNKVVVSYIPNYVDASASVVVVDTTHHKLLLNESCQLGIKVGVSSTNNREIENQKIANTLNLVLGSLSGAVAIAGGVATGNPVALAGGVLSVGKTLGQAVVNNSQLYNRASGSISSSKSGVMLPQKVRIRYVKKIPISYDSNYAKLFGKPLNEYVKINELEGYTEVADVHIEDIGSITSNEFDELYAVLTTGFII